MGHGKPLGFGPHFSVHQAPGDQVLLLSEKRSFRLRGKLYAEMAPFLNGALTEDEIVEALRSEAAPDEVRHALHHLANRGYVHPRLPTPSAQQSLWLEWEQNPEEMVSALADWPLSVESMGESAAADAAAVEEMTADLADAGFPLVAADQARLRVLLVDDFLTPSLASVTGAAREGGQSAILLKSGGAEAWLGPRFDPDRPRCWQCLSRWIAEYRPGDGLVEGNGAAIRPARGMLRATLQLARAQATLALVRMASGDRDLDDHLLTFNSRDGMQARHYVRLDPACPRCGVAQAVEAHGKAADGERHRLANLAQEGRVASSDGGWRVLSTEEAESRLLPLVSPVTGIIPGLEDRSEAIGMPVVSAFQNMPKAVALADNRVIGRPGAAAGKGASLAQARVSCMAEALERYCSGYTGREPRRRARLAELGDSAIDPRRLLRFSEAQYRTRETWNKQHNAFNRVPEPFDPDEAIEWSPIYRLRDGARLWIPTRYCYYAYRDEVQPHGSWFCNADSNGCASGAVLGEAALQGLLELIERDAFGIFWYNRVRRPEIDLAAFDDPFLRHAQERYRRMGRRLYALDLRVDLGVPVVAAISCDEDGGAIQFGLGAHLDIRIALSRAVSEANQLAALLDDDRVREQAEDDDTARWMRTATLDNQTYLKPSRGRKRGPGDFPRLCEAGIGPGLEACCAALERAGLEPLVMDVSWPDLDFACARVVVPGLAHFWARFAPGRLYDVPVSLGWLKKPRGEAQLNPIPFFL